MARRRKAETLTQEELGAIVSGARELGVSPEELLTIMAYETSGELSPDTVGGKNMAYRGLIQGGAAAMKDFPELASHDFVEQVRGTVKYMKAKGVAPGEGALNMYAAVNAGYDKPNRYDWSDRPGKTVRSHVDDMMHSPYNQQAKDLLAQYIETEPNREGQGLQPTIAAREPPERTRQYSPYGIDQYKSARQGISDPQISMMDLFKQYQEDNKPQHTVAGELFDRMGVTTPGDLDRPESMFGALAQGFSKKPPLEEQINKFAPVSDEAQMLAKLDPAKKQPQTLAGALFNRKKPNETVIPKTTQGPTLMSALVGAKKANPGVPNNTLLKALFGGAFG